VNILKPKVSETTKVYFDLSNIEVSSGESDGDDAVMATSKNKRKKKLTSTASRLLIANRELETIPQDFEVDETDSNHNADPSVDKDETFESAPGELQLGSYKPILRSANGEPDESQGTNSPSITSEDLDSSDGSTCFYTKYPLRFPHGYSLSKYRHNLKLSYQTLSQKLEQHIVQMRGADETLKIKILQDILKLTKEAWDTPVYGRDLAYSLCDIIRMEGLLDQLIVNCST
ncbi:unnamed protein product, partial [Lymnaea stagnalis]